MSNLIPIDVANLAVETKQLEIDRLVDKLTVKHALMQELIDRGNHLAFLVLNGQQHEKEYAIKAWRKATAVTKV